MAYAKCASAHSTCRRLGLIVSGLALVWSLARVLAVVLSVPMSSVAFYVKLGAEGMAKSGWVEGRGVGSTDPEVGVTETY